MPVKTKKRIKRSLERLTSWPKRPAGRQPSFYAAWDFLEEQDREAVREIVREYHHVVGSHPGSALFDHHDLVAAGIEYARKINEE